MLVDKLVDKFALPLKKYALFAFNKPVIRTQVS